MSPEQSDCFFSRSRGKDIARTVVFRRLTQVCVFLLLMVPLLPARMAKTNDVGPERLVVIGDVHGDFDDFASLLKRAGLVNDENHWSGGATVLVQTGDVIDRGPKSREAMDLLMNLEKEAATAGGRVVPLLGNHEIMNVIGDLRYVPPQEYASFADGDSEKRRESAYQQYAAWYASHAKLLANLKQPLPLATEEEWKTTHPPGFLELQEAFSASGTYGKWIRNRNAVAKIGSILMLHGGIDPDSGRLSVEEINSQVRKELQQFDRTMRDLVSRKVLLPFFTLPEMLVAVQAELSREHSGLPFDADYHNSLVWLLTFNNWLCMKDNGPLWFRAYDRWSEEEGGPLIDKVLAYYGVKHVIVSHTVQKTAHIKSRFSGKVFLIDTGMLSSYWPGGQASALDIRGGKFTALYLGGQEVLLDDKPPESPAKEN